MRVLIAICCCFFFLSCGEQFRPRDNGDSSKPKDTTMSNTDTPSSSNTSEYTTPRRIGDANFEYWIHSPLHPQNREGVTFSAKINHPSGIKKASLFVFSYQLYKNTDGLPSKEANPSDTWGKVKAWNFSTPKDTVNLKYTLGKGFAAQSNVEYIFRVEDIHGGITEKLATFDAGDSPWPDDKILLYSTSRDSLKHKIDICFLSDIDYNRDWKTFLRDTEKLIYEGYHENNAIHENKDKWNFFYTKGTMDGEGVLQLVNQFKEGRISYEHLQQRASTKFPHFIQDGSIAGVDAFGLLHKKQYSDLTYLEEGVFNFIMFNTFTSEAFNHGTAVHETAHAVFKLSDEYDGCSCFISSGGSNIFESLKTCRDFNAQHGFPMSECTKITTGGRHWYKSEKTPTFKTETDCENYNRLFGYKEGSCSLWLTSEGQVYIPNYGQCIMENDGDTEVRYFRGACSKLIDLYYQKLELQNESNAPLALGRENIYGYEPVILLSLEPNDETWGVTVEDVTFGIPTENISKREYLDLEIKDGEDNVIHNLTLDDPGSILVHSTGNINVEEKITEPKFLIAVPYTASAENVECNRIYDSNGGMTIRGVVPSKNKFNIKKDVQNKFKNFDEGRSKK